MTEEGYLVLMPDDHDGDYHGNYHDTCAEDVLSMLAVIKERKEQPLVEIITDEYVFREYEEA